MDIAIKCVTQWNAYMTMAIVMGLNLLLPNEIQERPITIQWTLSIIFLTTSTSMFYNSFSWSYLGIIYKRSQL